MLGKTKRTKLEVLSHAINETNHREQWINPGIDVYKNDNNLCMYEQNDNVFCGDKVSYSWIGSVDSWTCGEGE